MNAKLPDDQTLWFRNLPPKESDEVSEEVQDSAGKEPEIELFIEPLTGLAIPMPNQKKKGAIDPFYIFPPTSAHHLNWKILLPDPRS